MQIAFRRSKKKGGCAFDELFRASIEYSSAVISDTKGYVCVPASWWKTGYFEIRCEDQAENRR